MNIANKLTLLRVIMIPFFMYFLLKSQLTIALVLFCIASFTDFLDGYLARSMNLITNFGKFMDPLADKLLVTSALLGFVELGSLSSWIVMIIIAREFIVSIFRAIAASEGIVIAASWWGKSKTISQMIMIIIMLLNNYPFSLIGLPMDQIFIWIATALTIISGADYIIKNKQVLK
ncbi:CDP-diacylglycerol--glycerol-3-phosphate 3-phosphatidyltransferase [Fusibacter paucivorans]|uniref:CDP-diacylglycerol--glycerol-3-phosphate 3-phosphatidyltransferase n=1 Tax=Fusibacter paucivorans TaxID=76009 RepID=A0ABS5PSE4_9FIRM|nr:CDP-diacylglycerol--glycerol-3-phosphate 3-phosphatidyltransferase [Fusibacter paucivorans]MBS7527996.1 CDP-diacylglycerol--glycerol-3-phosphate 3-phosphatidyltransferase [Fusibacter paucivorans]